MGLHDRWSKNAIMYCLDVETYADSDGDGVGDFAGLTSRLDYLSGLGVTCLWLMPCYPTPNGDDGYDVADYTTVDPRLGTMADAVEFFVEAKERGLHVIVDLVPNHTSDQHPWFQSARADRDSPYRDYYVWRDDDPGDTSDKVVFPGEQQGIWSFSEPTGAWYLHHFYRFQPDLNFANPQVREEFRRIIGLWLRLGVDGFRIDAAPFLINLLGVDVLEDGGSPRLAHDYLKQMKEFVEVRQGNAILLGEVDVGLSTLANYFGGGNELQALFNFPVNRYLFLGLAQESADPIRFGLTQLPAIPEAGQWVNFLRHHDELNLSRLTGEQREQIFAAFAPEPEQRIFDRGIRRRLAPMLDNDPKRLRLAYSLLFGLPGAPMIFYGEEIGMGEQLDVPGRLSVRTPMQWTPRDGGGFSTAPEEDLVRPILAEGEFGYRFASVGAQRGNQDSVLNWMAALTRARRECEEIGIGAWRALETGHDGVLALRFDVERSCVIVVNNLASRRCTIDLGLTDEERSSATDLFGDRDYESLHEAGPRFRVEGYGYRWLRVGGIY